MKKTVIIGGGASGMIAAIKASENNEVIILEKNDKLGKKLLLTGNGNCNFWHDKIDIDSYYSDNNERLVNILKRNQEVYDFLLSLGIYPKNKNGYLYPYAMQSSSFKKVLESNIKKRNINVIYNANVTNINYLDNKFEIYYKQEKILSDSLIISTGSKAYPKTGSDGYFYDLLKEKGFLVNDVLPALTSLKGNESYFKEWSGIRCDAEVSIYIDNKLIKSEIGEIQLTDYGVSGICIFNLSGIASRAINQKQKVDIHINFAPYIDNFKDFINNRCKNLNNYVVGEVLESIYNYKLLNVMLKKSGYKYDDHIDDQDLQILIETITNFTFNVKDTGTFERSQVCTGGISLNEIKDDMETTKIDNLYLTGELLDVDGICGGYNLAFAFISGYIAGSSIKK